jgi:CRISPR type IV-associated DEAD/DEAH-box helicase Csf4
LPVSIKTPKTLTDAMFPNQDVNALTDDQVKALKAGAKSLIERAITEKLNPADVRLASEHDFVGHITINILNKFNRGIIKHAMQTKKPEATAALAFLMAAINRDWHLPLCDIKETPLHGYLSAMGYSKRDEQDRFYNCVDASMVKGKVGMVEASTGIGKTFGILINANERSLESDCFSLIATNSLSNIQQYLIDYDELSKKDVTLAPLHLIIGRQNFVSINRLCQWMLEDSCPLDQAAVKKWIARGGRNKGDPEALPTHTLESLRSAEPNVIDSEVRLTMSFHKDDLGYQSYRDQFIETEDGRAGILLVTHAMLCTDIKLRRLRHGMSDEVANDAKAMRKVIDAQYELYMASPEGDGRESAFRQFTSLSERYRHYKMAAIEDTSRSILPNYGYLYVDEGHLLENAMANILSESISLRSVLRDVKQHVDNGSFPTSRYKDAMKAVDTLIDLQSKENKDEVLLNAGTNKENVILLSICELLLNNKGKKKSAEKSWVNQIRQLKYYLDNLHRRNTVAIINYSPVRRYPQVNIGQIDTGSYLRDMWARVQGAVVVSATLYIKRYNTYSSNYIASLLAVSRDQKLEFPPVVAPWIKSTVKTIFLPPKDRKKSDKLMPIGRAFKGDSDAREKAKDEWVREVANYINNAYQSSAGGVMVLMTAFDDVIRVKRLLELMDNNLRIVAADGNITLDEQKAQFVALTKTGARPLWITLGNAWIGLDINGKNIGLKLDEISERDNVLTDLIIAKIPFGTNRSLTHQMRMIRNQHRSSDIELMNTMMLLKQGFGRLVRLENQPKNRRIHLLDGRLSHPQYKGYLSMVRALIDTYPKTEHIGR